VRARLKLNADNDQVEVDRDESWRWLRVTSKIVVASRLKVISGEELVMWTTSEIIDWKRF